MYCIGIDIGTSSICGVAYNLRTKQCLTIVKENDAGLPSNHPWEKRQEAGRIEAIVEGILSALLEQCGEVQGIGLTGQMHGMLYVNECGEAVSPLYTWQDGRGNLMYQRGESYADYLSRAGGYPLATGYGLVTHFYNLCNKKVPAGAHKLCTVMDYVAMRLCKRKAPLTDPSNAAGLGFFHKKQLRFDIPACIAAGLSPEILPEVVPSGTLAGHYGHIPVYTAIGDNQASYLGAVRDFRRSIHLTVGTSSQLSVYSERYMEIEGMDTRPLPVGGYLLVGAPLCGGASFAMLKNFFAEVLGFFTGQRWDDREVYRRMTALPYRPRTEDDLQIETLFAGTRLQPEKRGSIENISLANLTPANLIKGFLTGIGKELHDFYELLPREIRQEKNLLIGSGNGIKKNPLLRKILEEQFETPLTLSEIQEEAAFGACACASQWAHAFPNKSEYLPTAKEPGFRLLSIGQQPRPNRTTAAPQ